MSIDNSLIIETFEKKSYRKRKRLYNKDTHGISNHLFKNYWKSEFNIPELEKEEESARKEKLKSW